MIGQLQTITISRKWWPHYKKATLLIKLTSIFNLRTHLLITSPFMHPTLELLFLVTTLCVVTSSLTLCVKVERQAISLPRKFFVSMAFPAPMDAKRGHESCLSGLSRLGIIKNIQFFKEF